MDLVLSRPLFQRVILHNVHEDSDDPLLSKTLVRPVESLKRSGCQNTGTPVVFFISLELVTNGATIVSVSDGQSTYVA